MALAKETHVSTIHFRASGSSIRGSSSTSSHHLMRGACPRSEPDQAVSVVARIDRAPGVAGEEGAEIMT